MLKSGAIADRKVDLLIFLIIAKNKFKSNLVIVN